MSASHTIREAVTEVEGLRQLAANHPALADAISSVKRFQSRRFAHSYSDLLKAGPYQAAAEFFLVELYGDKDYSKRDTQFARIAGAIETLLPKAAIATAVSLAQLHALTERMDYHMGLAWEQDRATPNNVEAMYVAAWRTTGKPQERWTQLQLVLEIGTELEKLTGAPGLRLLLKLMRNPAATAGLQELQQFLEKGFDTFAAMRKRGAGARGFLEIIKAREAGLISGLFDLDCVDPLTNMTAPISPQKKTPNQVAGRFSL